MIVGKEGQPRSGKSYETVKYDILEALKAQRKTYFRLNGVWDNRAKIAEYLAMPLETVEALLVPMNDDQVHEWLVCDTNPDGSLVFPHIEKGALVIVDEVHEYWGSERAKMAERNANFFAKHGHIGLDIVLMSQDFKEVHRSAIRRMQRKNIYTKLDALGKDQSYSVRFYSAPTVGKFELTGSEKRDYDPAIFPLYHGIQPGIESQAVYKTGSKTVWQTAKKPAIFVALALVIGIAALVHFFTGAGIADKAQAQAAKKTVPQSSESSAVYQRPVAVATAPQPAVMPEAVKQIPLPVDKRKDYPAGVRYVLDLIEDARPRFAGTTPRTMLMEFRTSSGNVIERLSTEDMKALGWEISTEHYGAKASYKDEAIIFTAWPVDPPGQQSDQTTARIRAAGGPVTSDSETQPRMAAQAALTISGPVVAAGYGAMERPTESANVGEFSMRRE